MRLLAGHGGIIGVLLCTSDFLQPRHYSVPCVMQNTSVFAMSAMDVGHIDTYSPGSDVNGQRSGAILCLPGFWAPQSVVLTTGASHMSALALW